MSAVLFPAALLMSSVGFEGDRLAMLTVGCSSPLPVGLPSGVNCRPPRNPKEGSWASANRETIPCHRRRNEGRDYNTVICGYASDIKLYGTNNTKNPFGKHPQNNAHALCRGGCSALPSHSWGRAVGAWSVSYPS